MESNKEKNTILVLRIIIVLLIIAIIVIAVFKKINSNNKNNEINNTETGNNINEVYNNMKDEETITTTEAKVRLSVTGDYYEYVDLSIENGNIIAKTSKYNRDNNEQDTTYTSIEKTFTLDNEKVKYLHYDYYQSGQTNVIYLLTESGNVYVNEFTANNQTIDIINEFKKMNYSNVLELVKKKNENYGTENEVGIVDNRMYYIYARTNNELIKLDNQYDG